MLIILYTKNGEESLFFCNFFKSVDKLSELAGRNAETQAKINLDLEKDLAYNVSCGKRNTRY